MAMSQKQKQKWLYGILFLVGLVVAIYNLSSLISFILGALGAVIGIALMIFSGAQYLELNKR